MNEDEVKIEYKNKVYIGFVRGLKNKFPSIWIPELDRSYEFSWQAVNRARQGAVLKCQ